MRLSDKNKIFSLVLLLQMIILLNYDFSLSAKAQDIDAVNVTNPFSFVSPIISGVLGSVDGAAAIIEQRYHLDQGALQGIGEYMNVGENKTQAPEVDIFFSPSSPKVGEKLTATA
ncbi:MAG: hypothetical protein WCZ08_02095, partial [Parcubacteria group bacterium]